MISRFKNKLHKFIRNAASFHKQDIINTYDRLSLQPNCIGTTNEKYADGELIVSLTTYGKRINDVHLAIESILQQTLKPNRIILWLSKDEFYGKHIPIRLTEMTHRGLEIRFCEDYLSYKKIIPTLIEFPEATIITLDDDLIYPRDLVEKLYYTHLNYPDDIICARAHKIKYDKTGKILPYNKWHHDTNETCGIDLLPTGGAGCLYPKNCFHQDITNWDLIANNCLHADDIWLRFMTLLNDKIVRKGYFYEYFFNTFIELNPNDNDALYHRNVLLGENTVQFTNLLNIYPEITTILIPKQ